MNKTQWSRHWRAFSLVGAMMVLLLLIVACGDEEATEAPTQAPAAATRAPSTTAPTMAPTATMAPSTPAPTMAPTRAATRAATRAPTPRPTATPRPTPTATPVMAKVLVSPRLKISMVPPGHQVTMVHQTFHSSSGPLKTMYEEMIYIDPYSGDFTNAHLASDWSVSDDATSWDFTLRQGIPFHSTDSWTGTEFTVKDVLHSIRTSAGETSYNPGRWNIYGVADAEL